MAENMSNKTAFQQYGPRRGGSPTERFGSVEHAKDTKGTIRRLAGYFGRERGLLFAMIGVVVFGTACGVYAPSLQSSAVDMIAGSREGRFGFTLILMLGSYLLFSGSQFLQDYISAHLSQRIVKSCGASCFPKSLTCR